MHPKTLLLDLGGVIIHIDPERVEKKMRAFRPKIFDEAYKNIIHSGLIERMETGQIGADEFLKGASIALQCTKTEVKNLWLHMLIGIPAENIGILRELSNRYQMFLLSNTNPIHMKWIFDHLRTIHKTPHFKGIFERMFLSYEMHSRKPEPEIFEQVIRSAGLNPQNTIFIDDSAINLQAAASLGFRVLPFTFNGKLAEILPLLSRNFT